MWPEPLNRVLRSQQPERQNHYLRTTLSGVQFGVPACLNSDPQNPDYESGQGIG